MVKLTPRILWLAAGVGAALVAGQTLLTGQARQAAMRERLAALDSCLIASNQRRALAAAATLRSIRYFVGQNRNAAADVAVLRVALRIQARTQVLTDSLRQLRQHWPPASAPAALGRLALQVRQYNDTIRQFVPDTAPLDQPSEALFHQDWLNQTSLAQASRPVVAAALTRLEAKVRQLNADALAYQAQKVGSRWDGFDRIGAVAVPASQTVAPGAVYEAKLLLATSSLGSRVRFSANGRELPFDPSTGQGSVSFRIPAARPGQPDTMRAQWQGQAQFWYQLADTVLTTTVPYLIVQPPHPR